MRNDSDLLVAFVVIHREIFVTILRLVREAFKPRIVIPSIPGLESILQKRKQIGCYQLAFIFYPGFKLPVKNTGKGEVQIKTALKIRNEQANAFTNYEFFVGRF